MQEPAQLSGNQSIPGNANGSQAPPQDQSGVQIEEVVEDAGDQAEAKPESLSKKKKYLAEKIRFPIWKQLLLKRQYERPAHPA